MEQSTWLMHTFSLSHANTLSNAWRLALARARWLVVLVLLAACQPAEPAPLPTLARLPSVTPQPTPTHTVTPQPTPTREILPAQFSFGKSAGGLELQAFRVGTGERLLMVVGGVHAGYEANTIQLVRRLYDHALANPQELPDALTLLFVPVLNVDGIAAGRDARGRLNANGVDLNRNWGCGWSAEAYFGEKRVNSGSAPFSEPETLALGGLIERVRPSAVLFYHAAARGVFAGNCGGMVSQPLAEVYGRAIGYPYDSAFSKYAVTGTAPAWVDSLGIPAADVELASAEGFDFVGHWRALRAVMAWLDEN